jgi:hypothetical protein
MSALSLMLVGAMMSGCARSFAPKFVPDGGSLSSSDVESMAQSVDLSPVAGIDVEHAPDARTDALVWLRRQGALGDRAATLLTVGFPDRTASVPLVVEIAQVDGVRSLVVVEAFGASGGPLAFRRLWLFDLKTGDLVRSSAFR